MHFRTRAKHTCLQTEEVYEDPQCRDFTLTDTVRDAVQYNCNGEDCYFLAEFEINTGYYSLTVQAALSTACRTNQSTGSQINLCTEDSIIHESFGRDPKALSQKCQFENQYMSTSCT